MVFNKYFMLIFIIGLHFIGIINARSDHPLHMRLPRLQAENLWQLFIDRNAALQFDIQPNDGTESVLLSVYRQLPLQRLLEVKVSTSENKIIFTHLTTGNTPRTFVLNAPLNDGEWHKLIIVINGDELQVTENCHQLLKKAVYDMEFPLVQNIRAHVGEDINGNLQFEGKMREFSADSGNPIQLKCPNLEIMMDSPVETIIETTDVAPRDESYGGDDNDGAAAPTEASYRRENSAIEEKDENFGRLEERVTYLEDQFKHWKSIVQGLDGRIKKVELHQRGCQIGGRIISFGEKQQNVLNCTECQCSSTGELHCGAIGCQHVKCAHPIQVFGECCPKCGAQCFYNGRYFEHGEEFWPKSCVRCFCANGKMTCQFRKAENCPVLECNEQVTPENQCCPQCVNVDFCAAKPHPCDPNAECQNGPFGAKCKCKTVNFFCPKAFLEMEQFVTTLMNANGMIALVNSLVDAKWVQCA
jgi:hypothetical protein